MEVKTNRVVMGHLTLCVDGVNVRQEYDDHGCHRICYKNTRSTWVGYQSIARTGNYRGTSEYYGSDLPRIFKIIPGK